jgi:hypothetical protein
VAQVLPFSEPQKVHILANHTFPSQKEIFPHFGKCFRGYWYPSGEFATGARGYATLGPICITKSEGVGNIPEIPQRLWATFAESTYLSEGHQYSLIISRGYCYLPDWLAEVPG